MLLNGTGCTDVDRAPGASAATGKERDDNACFLGFGELGAGHPPLAEQRFADQPPGCPPEQPQSPSPTPGPRLDPERPQPRSSSAALPTSAGDSESVQLHSSQETLIRTLLLWVVEPRSPSEDLQSRAHVTPPQAPSVVCGTSSNGVEGPWAEALRSRQELGFV
ncbi:hypothetical protein MG293_008000 [Ovis ammon polii]|uniref:Uncharacterized protein n=1 Tax=Ovis ammon polii TaxID=230172 RepID=A0AAD4YDM4_OVIAM|nr:hypothetical protein MG293_008000 [Ovis ammon polii]